MELLEFLLDQGLAPDERTARGLIMAGRVLVDEMPVTSVHSQVTAEQSIRVKGDYAAPVSRGALKLRPALARLKVDPRDRVCLDLGASTGGFTQMLLENGAARVYAVDVGYGILAHKLRVDSRVVVLERTNARTLDSTQVPEQVDLVVGDLSFISWGPVLPAVRPLLSPEAELVLLVKPQFELAAAGRDSEVPGGLVTDTSAIQSCLEELYNVWVSNGLSVTAVVLSPLRGAKGNRELFVHLTRASAGLDTAQYAEAVAAELAGAGQ